MHAPKVVVIEGGDVFFAGTRFGSRVQQLATLLEVIPQVLELRLQKQRRCRLKLFLFNMTLFSVQPF